MRLILPVALALCVSIVAHAQKTTASDKIAADETALQLAVSAIGGDSSALAALEKGADSNVGSSQFGLAMYYASSPGVSFTTTDALTPYLKEKDPSIERAEETISRDNQNNPKALHNSIVNKKIRELLEFAVRSDDPAAESMLGTDLFFSPIRFSALLKFVDLPLIPGSDQWNNIEYAYTSVCKRAFYLLRKSDAAGWPKASGTLSIAWFYPAKPELLAAGCTFGPDQRKSDMFLIRSASLGDPVAMQSLIEKYQEEDDTASADMWLARLNAAVARGVPGATNARTALQSSQ